MGISILLGKCMLFVIIGIASSRQLKLVHYREDLSEFCLLDRLDYF